MIKNKTVKTFLLIIVLAVVSIVVSQFSPRYRLDVSHSKWQWIKSKIYGPKQTVDYAIIGSSYPWCGIKSNLISQAFAGVVVWNLSRNWDGRDVDYFIVKRLLEEQDVKNILVHFYDDEVVRPHPYTPSVISPAEAAAEFFFTMKTLPLTDPEALRERVRSVLSYFGNLSVRAYMQRLRGEGSMPPKQKELNDRSGGFYIYDAALKQNEADLEPFKNNQPWTFEVGKPRAFPALSRVGFYLDRMHRLCEAHGVNLYFVYLPRYYETLPGRGAFDFFSERGEVLMPNMRGLTRREYWRDRGHLYQRGSEKYTRRLIRLLKNGKEDSPYYKLYR